jgi:hypothetical protein
VTIVAFASYSICASLFFAASAFCTAVTLALIASANDLENSRLVMFAFSMMIPFVESCSLSARLALSENSGRFVTSPSAVNCDATALTVARTSGRITFSSNSSRVL